MSQTRLHSSRMHTARALTISPSLLCAGGVYLVLGGVPGPGGVPGLGGVPGPRGTWLVPGGGGVPGQVLPPPVDRITDTCKNITLPQLCCGR